jgi:hypothetical protein
MRCSKELMQLYGDLDTLPFVRISRLNWIGRVSRMGSNRKVSQVHNNNNPQGSQVRGQPKNRRWNCAPTDVSKCKIKSWIGRSKTGLAGRSPLRGAGSQ